MRIYLDQCCFNRPFDAQTQVKIQLETKAKLFIQHLIKLGAYDLIWSYMLDTENSVNPYERRKMAIQKWKNIAQVKCCSSNEILELGTKIQKEGIHVKDSLHIACAIVSKADYFITTDKLLLKKTIEGIRIMNPVDFISEMEV